MSMKTVEGVVMRTNERQVNTTRGPAPVFSALINEGTGESWYNFGFKTPNLTQHQQVKFVANSRTYTNKDGIEVSTWDGDSNTIETLKTAEAAAPAVMKKAVAAVDDRQRSIVYQSAYQRAIMIVTAALENDALVLPGAKGKRLDSFKIIIDELALELAHKFINPPADFSASVETDDVTDVTEEDVFQDDVEYKVV